MRPDPIGLAGGINLFPYAWNNPVNEIDPEGLAPVDSEGNLLVPGSIDHCGVGLSPQFRRDLMFDILWMATPIFFGMPPIIAPPARQLSNWRKLSGMLRSAAKGKGNIGIGSATRAEAKALGRAWVGPHYSVARDGKTLISSDRLRQYHPPSYKPGRGG